MTSFFKVSINNRKFQIVFFFMLFFIVNVYSQKKDYNSIVLRDSLYSIEVQTLDLGQFTFDELAKMKIIVSIVNKKK